MRRPAALWMIMLFLAVGCGTDLDNPADPDAGSYIGYEPWVDAGRQRRATINDTLMLKGLFHGPQDKVKRYGWDFDADGLLDRVSPTTGVMPWAFSEVGTYHPILMVEDLAGFFMRDTTEVEITNETPQADAGSDRVGYPNRAVELSGQATDDGGIVEYRWDYQGDGTFDWKNTQSGFVQVLYPEVGTYRAVFEVVDDDANAARDTAVVSIELGVPTANAGEDVAISINDWVSFRGTGFDLNGEVLLYEWDFEGDGVFEVSSAVDGLAEHLYAEMGTFRAVLRVTDDDGYAGLDTALVGVTNNPPAVENLDLGTGWCAKPQKISARVSDDGVVVWYEWDFEGDGAFDWHSETSSEVEHFYGPGTYSPILRVIDDDGNATTETLTYRVGPWTTGRPMKYPRSGVGVEAVGGILYVVSGFSPETGANTAVLEAYDPRSRHWETRSPMALKQAGLATAVIGDRLYAVAGCATEEVRGAVEEYWPEWDQWYRRASVRQRRCWPAATAYDGSIYVFGGVTDQEQSIVEVLYPPLRIWNTLAPMPTARHGMAAVVLDNAIYVIGGFGGGRALSTVEVYFPGTDTWETRSPMPTPRTALAAVAWNGKIYAIGGSYTDAVEIYDPATDTWTPGTPMPTRRYGLGAAVIDELIYVAGGQSPSEYLATLEVYSPACDEFR